MAATVQGTAYIVGIGSTALTNLEPVSYTKEEVEVSKVVRDGHGAAKARVIKDTLIRYTFSGPYSTAVAGVAAGAAITFTDDAGGSITGYCESRRQTRSEDEAILEFTVVKEAGITYS